MPIFEYRAVTEAGEAVSGTVLGPTWDAAATDLQQRGLKIQEMAVASAPGDPVPADFQAGTAPPREAPRDISSERSYAQSHVVGELVGKVPLSDLLFFFRQLSTMLKAGVGMVQTLDTLGRQSRNGKLRAVLGELRQHALEGRPMSFGMQRYPEVFSPLMLSLVRAGEEGGMLEDTLRQIAD